MKANWEYKKLGDVVSFVADGDWIECRHQSENGFRLIQTGNVGNGFFKAKDDKPHYISEETFKELGCTEIFVGDCLVSRLPDPIGRACIIPNVGVRMITAVDCTIIRFKDSFFSKFFVYYTRSKHYKKEIEKKTTGSTRKRISRKNLESVSIPVPPLSEQQRIVAELDLLTGIIDKQKAQLKELDTLAQSIFYDMFGDPIENPKGWEVKTLENVGKCVSGGTPSRKNAEYFKGNIDWYSAGELNSLYLDGSIEKITEEALDESAAKLCKANSLFIGMYDTAAFKLGITKTEATSNQACANIFPNEDNVIWLYFVLSIMRDEALKFRHGARQKNLNLGFIKSFSVPIPPLALQQQFADKIQSIENQKAKIKASIVETQKLLDYTMDKYFG